MTVECDQELLQDFLDGELEPEAGRRLQEHLGQCRHCRREFSRQRRLWLELAQAETVAAPPELPYLRQQAIAAARPAPAEASAGTGFLESQRLAWAPLGLAAAYLPGAAMARAIVRDLPGLLAGALYGGGRRLLKARLGKKGRR